jgi:predicted SAM-dependent methyltransferase
MPGIGKGVKNAIRKLVFQPFGYDLVPLKATHDTPMMGPTPSLPKLDGENLEIYIRWFGEKPLRQRRFYNIGAEAAFKHPAWTKINHPSAHYGDENLDIAWDLDSNRPLPIEDGQAKVIFSRYTLEHANNAAVEYFLSEAFRTLSEDGFLRLIVPDIEIYYAAYLLKDEDFFYRPKHDLKTFPNEDFGSNINLASFEQKFLWSFASSASTLHAAGAEESISDQEFQRIFAALSLEDALDYCLSKCSLEVQRRHPENHINWFSAGKLGAMMHKAGFGTVYRSGYGQSQCAVLRDVQLLEDREPGVGLFMEGRKVS